MHLTALREGKPVPASELKAYINGQTIDIGGNKASFGADGSYLYNGRFPGKYSVYDGKICVDFDGGGKRCDRILKHENKYHFFSGETGGNGWRSFSR